MLEELQLELNEILKGNQNYKSEDQISAMKNLTKLYKGWGKVVKFYNDYTRMIQEWYLEAEYKSIQGEELKILTPIQMLQRLPIVHGQVRAGNTSENLIYEIRQVIYSLYQEKEITKKVYNNIMSPIKLWKIMDTIFMNSENIKTSDTHRLLLNLWDKINLKRNDKYVDLSNLSIYNTWENVKKSYQNTRFQISAPTWNLNYLSIISESDIQN